MRHATRVVIGSQGAVATCSCTWTGHIQPSVQLARKDANQHEFDALTAKPEGKK